MAIAAPNHSEEDLERLINDVLDWQYMHGSLLKIPPDTGKILARPIGSYKALPGVSHAIFPPNPTPSSIVQALCTAYARYGRSGSLNPKRIATLMVVQPNNVNICDERPIEETLWAHDIPTFRVEFGQPVLDATTLSPSSELLFHPWTGDEMFEIAVVYYRAGYDEEEYDPSGIAARVRLEKSKAIKCPSILTHIAGSKRVQQELAMPGVLERFLPAHEAAKIRKTFMPMYPLDETDAGMEGRKLALNPVTAERYVLKPSKDGGGHNVYGSAIPGYLQSVPQKLWPNYILMERIAPPSDIHNSLISFRGLYSGPVVSELGVFGMCLWEGDEEKGLKIEEMGQGCFSFKSKASDVDEMSVVKGYGCFDSPWLV
ncbi:MAG: hypothetical protein LQ338_005853 [Usnochroma carphineum]|nr:MAG: hypothetical protein LQ338_005853 [Usnochroma carphineum]